MTGVTGSGDWRPALQGLPVLRLACHVRLLGGEWPEFKGFLLHGALGATLSQVAPAAYGALMGAGDELARPYVLVPPLAPARRFLPGSELVLELVLMGAGVSWALPCLMAVQRMGAVGLGRGQARFELVRVEQVLPGGGRPVFSPGSGMVPEFAPISAWEVFEAALPSAPVSALCLDFVTPVRLKAGNHLVRQAPDHGVLFQRLFGRVGMLARAAGAPDWPVSGKSGLLAAAAAVNIRAHRLAWEELSRYSARQQAEMRFGGLTGQICFAGDLAPFVPWWRLAEYVHLGGKTSFGLGKVLLSPQP